MRCLTSKTMCRYFSVFKFIIMILSILLVFSTSHKFVSPIMNAKGGSPEFTFRDFFVDEPILYATKEQTLYVLNNSGLQELTILGEQVSSESYRGFILKHNEYLVLMRREHYFGQSPEYINYLEIVDVSDVTNPVLISEVTLPTSYDISSSKSFHSRGVITIESKNYLFIHARLNNHFLCVNLTDISQPEMVEYNDFPGVVGTYYDYYQLFHIRDNKIFIPTSNTTHRGFVVYNFTTLQSMTKVTEWFGYTNLSGFDSIYASQEHVYMKNDETFIEVFDIQNLTAPIRKGYINLGSCLFSAFRGNYLFAFLGSRNYTNLTIFDYSNITDLKITSFYSHPGDAYGSFNFNVFTDSMITNTNIYVPIQMTAYCDKSLYILDWSNPNNLFVKATLGFPFPSTDGFPIISSSFLLVTMICIVIFVKVKYNKKVK